MYERYTERARKVMKDAGKLAKSRNSIAGVEDIFLCIVAGGVAGSVLTNLDYDIGDLHDEFRQKTDLPQQKAGQNATMTKVANRAIEASIETARSLNHNYVGDEHLLLGLLKTPSKVLDFLKEKGITYDSIYQETEDLLGPGESHKAPRLGEVYLNGEEVYLNGEDVYVNAEQVAEFVSEEAMEIYLDPGNADAETIRDVLVALSDLQVAAGGCGLEFVADDLHIRLGMGVAL